MSEPEIADRTPRENPVDETPHKKARGGEAAVDRTKSAAAPTTIADVANVNDDEAMSGGCRRPAKAPPAIASAGRLRPTIVVETVDEDGTTGEEFSLASEDNRGHQGRT